MTFARLIIPRPPSVNGMFRNVTRAHGRGTGRVLSSDYLRWRRAAAGAIFDEIGNCPPLKLRFTWPVRVSIQVRNKSSAEDCDNRIKAVLDLLVECDILEGDSAKYVRSVFVEWQEKTFPHECVVAIKSV